MSFLQNHRRFLLGLLLGAFLLPSCMRPVDSDFDGKKEGLADQELLWIVRIPAHPGQIWEQNIPREDSMQFERVSGPLFREVLPVIIRDVLEGKLEAYEDYSISGNMVKVESPEERLKQFGGTMQNYSPLVQVVELFSIIRLDADGYSSEPKFLRLVWMDPEAKLADRYFAGIPISALSSRRYYYVPSGREVPFQLLINNKNLNFLPIYLHTNEREYSIRTPEEGSYVREKVLAGKWKEIEWVEDGINISGKKKRILKPEQVLDFGGAYAFKLAETGDSLGKDVELYLTPEKDYLIADWSHRFRIEKIMAFGDSAFFSHSGELYFFDYQQDSTLSLAFIHRSDTAVGRRIDHSSGKRRPR